MLSLPVSDVTLAHVCLRLDVDVLRVFERAEQLGWLEAATEEEWEDAHITCEDGQVTVM
jgi:hypothetical protein